MASGAVYYWLTLAVFVLLLARTDAYGVSYDDLIVLECDIKVKQKFPDGGETVLQIYECNDIEVFEDSDNAPTSYVWNNSPFSQTHPKDACSGPVRPVVQVNQSHIAIVPTYTCEWRQECSYTSKADNLGSSGYVAYITWDEPDCTKSLNSQLADTFGNETAIAISVKRSTGWGLVGYANNSIYVIDVNVSLLKFGDLLMAFVGVSLGTITIICCCFCGCFGIRVWLTRERRTTMSNRTISRMTVKRKYRSGRSMNDTCSICLEDFNEGEDVRELPCKHVYHQSCVDVWLKNYKDECPNCKSSITAAKKRKKTTSEQSPLLAARDEEEEEEAVVNYGSTRRREGPEQEEEEGTQNGQVRLTAHNELEGSEVHNDCEQAHLSSPPGPNSASTELHI